MLSSIVTKMEHNSNLWSISSLYPRLAIQRVFHSAQSSVQNVRAVLLLLAVRCHIRLHTGISEPPCPLFFLPALCPLSSVLSLRSYWHLLQDDSTAIHLGKKERQGTEGQSWECNRQRDTRVREEEEESWKGQGGKLWIEVIKTQRSRDQVWTGNRGKRLVERERKREREKFQKQLRILRQKQSDPPGTKIQYHPALKH